ncbi:MAG: amino acid permease, partial [Mariniphaga sp.]|nr:amino acid permease [Mariniphaga sp.]
METNTRKFGTAPVFFTAISTILGAILFLRFGFAVGTIGFWGVILIILLGHLVTIPTALAISEIATNKRVEGGGEYFIISRSFGLNIGATIGIALFLSQAISVAFYVIAFTEAFEFFFNWIATKFDFILPRQVISIPVLIGLAI